MKEPAPYLRGAGFFLGQDFSLDSFLVLYSSLRGLERSLLTIEEKLQSKRFILNQKGLSLIEIMIVLVIIGSIMALGVVYLLPSETQELQERAVRISGTVKYLFDEAIVKKKYYRIAFDLDNSSYRVESSVQPFLLELSENEEDAKSKAAATESAPETQPDFATEAEDMLADAVVFPKDIKIKDIYVSHLKGAQTSGIVYVYIFPNGWVEPTVINLSDKKEEFFFSLEINPITGKVKIRNEYFELKNS